MRLTNPPLSRGGTARYEATDVCSLSLGFLNRPFGLRREFAKRCAHLLFRSVTLHGQGHLRSGCRARDRVAKTVRVRDCSSVESRNHVTATKSRAIRAAARSEEHTS